MFEQELRAAMASGHPGFPPMAAIAATDLADTCC